MKKLALTALFLAITFTAHAEIYKWVDESGSIHFSDKPYSEEAKEFHFKGTGISLDQPEAENKQEQQAEEPQAKQQQKPVVKAKAPAEKVEAKDQEKNITEADYKITSGVGKLGGDVISISGRIGSGPVCKSMTITATAHNDNNLSATVTTHAEKSSSHGSTVFQGVAKVSGSADDRGFWNVDTVKVRCND